ncbi:hypothetical protein FQZ97_903420 [compost metagenome]
MKPRMLIGKRLTDGMDLKGISTILNLWGFSPVTPLGLWAAWRFDFGAVSIWEFLVFCALEA